VLFWRDRRGKTFTMGQRSSSAQRPAIMSTATRRSRSALRRVQMRFFPDNAVGNSSAINDYYQPSYVGALRHLHREIKPDQSSRSTRTAPLATRALWQRAL